MSAKLQPQPADVPPPDPYEVLGVSRSASNEDIKAAYKKLALKYHPDKNQGNNEAIMNFQEVSQAYSILSTPELRKKYDDGGLQALKEVDLSEVPVDVSQMNFMSTTVFAMASKLGVPVKTVVSDSVHMAVEQGTYKSTPLLWDQPVTGRIANSQAIYYTLDITGEHIKAGFVISAVCNHCKVKLLMWDKGSEDEWIMLCQENAQKFGTVNVTGIHCMSGDTLENVPRPERLLLRDEPVESGWFRCLDGVTKRERLNIKPGLHLLAVYGDNFFKKSAYTLKATLLESSNALNTLEEVETQLTNKRHELHDFESEFKRVRAEFEKTILRLKEHETELEAIVKAREVAYLDLVGIPQSTAGTSTAASRPAESATQPSASTPTGDSKDEPKPTRLAAMDSVFKTASMSVRRFFGGHKKVPEKEEVPSKDAIPEDPEPDTTPGPADDADKAPAAAGDQV